MWDTGQVRENNDSEGQFQYNSMRHSTELLTSKNNADYFFKYIHIKPLKMVLRTKSQWRIIYSRKSTQVWLGGLWCFNKVPFLPSPSSAKQRLHSRLLAAKNPGLPSSLLEGFFPWRSWISVFLILSPTTCCWLTAVVGRTSIFPTSSHSWNRGFIVGAVNWDYQACDGSFSSS